MPRDQRDETTESARLLRLVVALNGASPAGIGGEALIKAAGFTGEPAEQRDSLARDIGELIAAGWDIQSVSARGGRSRYVLRSRNSRIQVGLTRAEQAELARAARLARLNPSDRRVLAGEPAGAAGETFQSCVDAVVSGRKMRVVHRGVTSVFHPRSVVPGASGWYVVGRRGGKIGDAYIAIDEIERLGVDQPATADQPPPMQRHGLDPAVWDADPPVEVSIDTATEFADDVDRAFGPALSRRSAGERVVLTFGVTNRAVFRARLYTFGTRVHVLSPAEIRDEILAELTAFGDAP